MFYHVLPTDGLPNLIFANFEIKRFLPRRSSYVIIRSRRLRVQVCENPGNYSPVIRIQDGSILQKKHFVPGQKVFYLKNRKSRRTTAGVVK